jgi:hypothetical protein
LGIKVDGIVEPIEPSILTKESCNNIFDIVKVTGQHLNKNSLIGYLKELTGKKIEDVCYVYSLDNFESFEVLNESVKFSDAIPYFSKKNERLLFSFRKNYFNMSFATGILALAMRKYNLDKDYKEYYKDLDISNDYELVHIFFRGLRPNEKHRLNDIQLAKVIYKDVRDSINANVFDYDVELVKDFIVSYLTGNARGNSVSKHLFDLGSFLYKFDRSVAFNTNKDISESFNVWDEYLTKDDADNVIAETDFYPFYQKQEPDISKEEYYEKEMSESVIHR